MKVRFPYTNPIVFKGSHSEEWQDALKFESVYPFVQPFQYDDICSFQILIKRSVVYANSRLRLYIREHCSDTLIDTQEWSNGSVGTYPTNFIRKIDAYTYVYCFCKKWEDFASTSKKIQLIVKVEKIANDTPIAEFVSNKISLCAESVGTKLIHYTHGVEYDCSIFDTYFSLMPYGYDLRLPCYFLQVQNKSNDEVFQAYDGTFELVSSIPYQVVSLEFTKNGIGLPDWFVANLNYIMKCYYKYIDGVQYQCTDNAELQISAVDKYNNRFCKIELSRKQRLLEHDAGGEVSLQGYISYDEYGRNGSISIVGVGGNYVLSANGYTFSNNIIDGNSVVNFYVAKNLTVSDESTTLNVIDVESGEIVASFTLVNTAFDFGICSMEVCDTLTIRMRKNEYDISAPPVEPPILTPYVVLGLISDITYDGAMVNVSVHNATADTTKTGVEIDTSADFSNPTSYEEDGVATFVDVDSLNDNTTYYVRAYIIDDGNTIYSDTYSSFTTLAIPLPSIVVDGVDTITYTTAVVAVTVNNPTADTTKTGVELDTDPLFSNPVSYEENGVVSSIAVDNLTENTTYYVRVYIIDNGVTIYSASSTNFSTLMMIPTISLVNITNVASDSADVNVSVVNYTARTTKTGVLVATDPLFSNPTTFEENGVVSTIAIDTLTEETTYYVKVYVIDNGVTIYSSNVLNFTTASGSILPKELQACEYLEADGSSWIKLDQKNIQYNNRIELKFSVVNDANNNTLIFGARTGANNNAFIIYPTPMYSEFRMWYGTGLGASQSFTYNFAQNTPDFIASTTNNNADWSIYDFNGNLIWNHYFNLAYPTGNQNLYLFNAALPTLNPASAAFPGTKIYYFEIETICKYIACYVKSGETFVDNKGITCPAGTCGMYDIVNNIFYTNDGTGTFSKGADINI